MRTDAHYYAVLAFARATGFKKESAAAIAHASQFVDDAIVNHMTIAGDAEGLECDVIDGRPAFFDMATCHSYEKIKTFNYSSMVRNTCPFHFVPGCKGETFARKLRCMQESPVILKIMDKAMEEDDPVRFGLTLHAYADTFSHQGFSGLLEKVNDISELAIHSKVPWDWYDKLLGVTEFFARNKFDKLFDAATPAYGHAQAITYPDMPHLAWSYQYDYSDRFSGQSKGSGQIDNKKRFREAFEGIRKRLEEYLHLHPAHRAPEARPGDFEYLFQGLLVAETERQTCKNWQRVIRDKGLLRETDPGFEYDKNAWLKDAFANYDEKAFQQRRVDGVRLKEGFAQKPWYRFYLAVKWYEELFYPICGNLGLNIEH